MTRGKARAVVDLAEDEGARVTAGALVGVVVGVTAAVAFGWLRVEPVAAERLVETPGPERVERVVVRLPAERLGFEGGVPVCVEGDRAWGVGDYKGVSSGGWAAWTCVEETAIPGRLGA